MNLDPIFKDVIQYIQSSEASEIRENSSSPSLDVEIAEDGIYLSKKTLVGKPSDDELRLLGQELAFSGLISEQSDVVPWDSSFMEELDQSIPEFSQEKNELFKNEETLAIEKDLFLQFLKNRHVAIFNLPEG